MTALYMILRQIPDAFEPAPCKAVDRPDELPPAFGEAIKQARLDQGLSKPDLEYRSGVAHKTITQIENGGNCTALSMYLLAEALGLRLTLERAG